MSLNCPTGSRFLICCLCAEWCGTCREFRAAFEGLRARFPAAEFVWIDIEDEPELVGDLDVENFPTLVIQRDRLVVFCGPMLPQIQLSERLIETLLAQDQAEAERYVAASAERQTWQGQADIASRLELRLKG